MCEGGVWCVGVRSTFESRVAIRSIDDVALVRREAWRLLVMLRSHFLQEPRPRLQSFWWKKRDSRVEARLPPGACSLPVADFLKSDRGIRNGAHDGFDIVWVDDA